MVEQKSISENQLKRAAATAGSIAAAGAIIGSVLTYVAIKHNMEQYIEQYVAEAYERQVQKQERVIKEEQPLQHEDLASKLGFTYEVDETKRDKRDSTTPYDDQINGTSYVFKIQRSPSNIQQVLTLFIYTGGLYHSSSVYIFDNNADNLPDKITLGEEASKVELTIIIEKNDAGSLEYENTDEKNARELLQTYTTIYQNFKQKHNIDELIHEYQPVPATGPLQSNGG